MRSLAAAVVLLASGCAGLTPGMNVRTEPVSYSPAMSSTVGIGLTTVYSPPAGSRVDYHWTTNFGYFVSWHAPDYKAVSMGGDVIATEGTLYWSYDSDLAMMSKPGVTITVEAVDIDTRQVLAKSKIKLDWEGDTAHVRDD